MAFRRLSSTEEALSHAKERCQWDRPQTGPAARPLPDDWASLCPKFRRDEAERAAAEFGSPELVQAAFYALALSDAADLGVDRSDVLLPLQRMLEMRKWRLLENWMNGSRREITAAHRRRARGAPSPPPTGENS